MVEHAGALPGEAETSPSLSDSRAQFVASLGRRLDALREALATLQQSPRSAPYRDHLRRRIHAFGAAAGVLGFEKVFEAFREAETVLGRSGPAVLGAPEIAVVSRTLDLVPSLVLGAAAPSVRPRGTMDRRGGAFPTSVLVFGGAPLAESLTGPGASATTLECERTEDPERAEEIVRVTAPDVAVIDADRKGARELMETLTFDPLLDPVRIIAVGTFERPEAAASLVALGVARVLPKPVSPDALRRSVLEVSRERTTPIHRNEPVGDATIEMLADRVAQEVRRGLVDAVRPEGREQSISLGEGADVLAAVWSSVARIRELVTLRSGGTVRFQATGPEGAVPLAPWMGDPQPRAGRGTERRSSDGVSLKGRTIVVVDDDPSIVWFLSGLFRATGAEVLEAHDGARALSLVRDRWPDLVVSDILMPGLDGFALCREIKRDVALADVPVILLSWKEDLLQRARELGADADGYLRKEATASVVVQRAREVLLPRARVEARVTAGGEVRGRLDGLTPRLILEIACRHGQDVHVTIRDAAFLYEVDVRDSHVRSATRTASDGQAETGERALSGLLGVRAGRFAVRPDQSDCVVEWSADLRDLLRSSVERARTAQGLLAKIERIGSIGVDAAGLEPYLLASPEVVRQIVESLAAGQSPASVVGSGVSSRLLESVLVDVILHGGVTRIIGTGGEDLLAASPPPSRQFESVETPPAAPPPVIPAAVSAAIPTAVSAAIPTAVAEVIPTVAPVAIPAQPSSPPSEGGDAGGATEFASFFLDSVVPPAPPASEGRAAPRSLPMKALAPPTSAPAEPSPLEMALRSLPDSLGVRREESPEPRPVTSPPQPVRMSPPRPDVPRATPSVASPPAEEPTTPSGPEPILSVEAPSSASKVNEAPSQPLPSTVRETTGRAPPSTVREGRGVETQPTIAIVAEREPAMDLGAAVFSVLGDDTPAANLPSPRKVPSEVETRRPTSTRGVPAVAGPASASSKATNAPSRSDPPRSEPPPSVAKGSGSSFGIMVVVCVAAVASYALVSAVWGSSRPAPPVPPAALTVAPPADLPKPVPSLPTIQMVGPADLDLPPGITVEPGKGLLEVDAPSAREVSVDGVALGTAPLRQIPLGPGSHEVRLRGDGVDLVRKIDIHEGRRTRLATTNPP